MIMSLFFLCFFSVFSSVSPSKNATTLMESGYKLTPHVYYIRPPKMYEILSIIGIQFFWHCKIVEIRIYGCFSFREKPFKV